MKISRKLRREIMLIAFDLVDGGVDDLEAMCEIYMHSSKIIIDKSFIKNILQFLPK